MTFRVVGRMSLGVSSNLMNNDTVSDDMVGSDSGDGASGIVGR